MVFYILLFSIVLGQLIKFPFGAFSSSTVLDLTILVLCLMGLKNVSLKKSLNTKYKTLSIFAKSTLVFLVIAFFSLILTPLNLNFFQYLFSSFYILRFAFFIIFALLISLNLIPRFNQSLLIIMSGLILSILGILQLIFIPNLDFLALDGFDPHYFRTVSTFLDPNFLGTYLVLTLITLVQFTHTIEIRFKYTFFLIIFIALVTTFSRSAGIILITSFLTMSFLKRSLKLFLLTLVLSVIFGVAFINYNKFVALPRNINRTESGEFRLNSWQQGIDEFSRSPIIGVGFNAYRFALEKYHLNSANQLQSRGSSSNDSSLIFILATTGILGFLGYLFFLFTIYKTALLNYKINRPISILLISGMTGLIINSFFINSLFYPFILIWIILILGQLITLKKI